MAAIASPASSSFTSPSASSGGGELALQEISREKPILANRTAPEIAARIVAFSLEQPAFGQIRVANQTRNLGYSISPPEPVEGRRARRLAAP